MININEEFLKRGLYKSSNFLENLGIHFNDFKMEYKEQILMTRFNQRSYYEIRKLVCASRCDCCDSRMKFLSIYSEIIHQKIHSTVLDKTLTTRLEKNNEVDAYFYYLKAVTDKKNAINLLLKALKVNNLFYDAFESLLFSVEQEDFVIVEKEIEENVTHFLAKRIYIIYFYVLRFKQPLNLEKYVNDIMEYYGLKDFLENNDDILLSSIKSQNLRREDLNKATPFIYSLLGAYYYTKKDYKLSKIFFELNLRNDVFCFEFLDMYSHIFYINNQIHDLAILAQRLTKVNQYKPETLMAIANYYSAKKDHENAIHYLNKSIKADERYLTNYTLIGHEYFERKLYNMALRCYIFSLKVNKDDYRAYFGIAQVKFQTCAYYEAEHYFKKAIELQKENGFFWISYGIVLEKLNKTAEAQLAYTRAKDEGDAEGYLKLADLFKKVKLYNESIDHYVKYVEECKKSARPCPKISTLLAEYFGKKGDTVKANYFRMMFE